MFKVYYLKVSNWCYLTKTKCVTQLWATTISFQCVLSINSRHISRVFSQKKWLLLQLIIVLKLKDIMKESRLSEALRMKRYYSSWGSETIEFVDDSNLLPCKFSIFIISYVISCSSYNLTTQSLNGISKSNIWFGIYLKISFVQITQWVAMKFVNWNITWKKPNLSTIFHILLILLWVDHDQVEIMIITTFGLGFISQFICMICHIRFSTVHQKANNCSISWINLFFIVCTYIRILTVP